MLQHPSLPVQIFSQFLQIKSMEMDGDGKAGALVGALLGSQQVKNFHHFQA